MPTLNMKRFILSAIAAFVFIFLFDWVFHGKIMMDTYIATANLWRPEAEMQAYFHWMTISQALLALVSAFVFTRHYEGKGVGEGARFGLYVGLLLAAVNVGVYAYMPIPLSLMVSWGVGFIALGLGTGIVLSLVYRK